MIKIVCLDVEAYAASWIEIPEWQKHQVSFHVEAYAASWIEINEQNTIIQGASVEAYAASWIEIQERMLGGWNICRRGLRSLVDWNFQKPSNTSNCCVEAYAASWIEIPENEKELSTEPVEAYAASWIEIYSQYL